VTGGIYVPRPWNRKMESDSIRRVGGLFFTAGHGGAGGEAQATDSSAIAAAVNIKVQPLHCISPTPSTWLQVARRHCWGYELIFKPPDHKQAWH